LSMGAAVPTQQHPWRATFSSNARNANWPDDL
jgi:hypothetical protein